MDQPLPSIAIVEDDPNLRESLAEVLASSGKWGLAGTYSNGEDAVAGFAKACPDIILMDIQLPGMSGIDCVAKIKGMHPAAQILMVTVYDNSDRIFNALAAGASGYLLKRDAPASLISSLDDLLAGGSPMSGAIARKVVQHFYHEPPAKKDDHKLTKREAEILELLVAGRLYKEIAWELQIGVETVRTHLRNIYSKLHVRTRTEAVVKYLGNS